MSDLKDILVPDVGGEEVEVIEICVAVGDAVEEELNGLQDKEPGELREERRRKFLAIGRLDGNA